MGMYRKKPVVIEALQFTGKNWDEVTAFFGGACTFNHIGPIVETLEGEMQAKPLDWIIKGVSGEYYPCKPDIFEKTYEEVLNG